MYSDHNTAAATSGSVEWYKNLTNYEALIFKKGINRKTGITPGFDDLNVRTWLRQRF